MCKDVANSHKPMSFPPELEDVPIRNTGTMMLDTSCLRGASEPVACAWGFLEASRRAIYTHVFHAYDRELEHRVRVYAGVIHDSTSSARLAV